MTGSWSSGSPMLTRALRRLRIALGAWLIDAGVRVTPDIPLEVEPDYDRMRRRTMAAVGRERTGGERRNGRTSGHSSGGGSVRSRS